MARIKILSAVGLAATLAIAFATAAEAGTATRRTVVRAERVYIQLSGMG